MDKIIKCDVFTPESISQLMASKLSGKGSLLEPSVGEGDLLRHVDISKYESVDVHELKQQYLDKVNVGNKVCGDFLTYEGTKQYDNIIMNPPYIKTQDLPKEYRQFLKSEFPQLKSGLVDVYYAFIIKCLGYLKDKGGTMVAITPNSYLYNKSALNMRKYLFDNQYIKEIIDYKDEKVFGNNVSVYCCITVFTKTKKKQLKYNGKVIKYSDIVRNYSLFNMEEEGGQRLGDVCKISNGIATLRDKVFVHKTKLFDEPCWVLLSDDKWAVYPYESGKIIPGHTFKKNNPQTYEFLKGKREELAMRDKGNKTYPLWYAYGRSQSLEIPTNKCVYLPCFLHPDNIEKSIIVQQGRLNHGHLCINPDKEEDIPNIINVIVDNIDFISDNSSKRSSGWINISSRVLKLLRYP